MGYDILRNNAILFGGSPTAATSTILGDTWIRDSQGWHPSSQPTPPSPRKHACMAYDSARARFVMFGGYSPSGSDLADTWEFDGLQWIAMNPPSSPPPRRHAGLAYMPTTGEVILFGGAHLQHLGDTWAWSNGSWQQLSIPGPSARDEIGLATDTARGRIVLFGGFNGGSLSDTWEFDGSNWHAMSPIHSPPPTQNSAIVFFPPTGTTVMFGGGHPARDATWSYDGVDWTQILTTTRPSPRYWVEYSAVYDPSLHRIRLRGGWEGTRSLNDEWLFDGSNWSPQLDYVTSNVGGRRYAITPAMTWSEAESLAVREGGHLATVRSTSEDAWISANLLTNDAVYWIGLNCAAALGTWVWSSGESPSFTNWYPGEPSYGGNGSERWASYNAPWNAGLPPSHWNDLPNIATSAGFPCYGIVELPGGPASTESASIVPTSSTPPPLSGHALSPLPAGGVLLFGGANSTMPQPFTYVLDNGSWAKQFSLLNPMTRVDHTLLMDPARQNNLLFGGRNPLGGALNDTWTWQGGQWNYLPLLAVPSPRSAHRMTFDTATNLGLLFGGKDQAGNPLGDFWSWDGSAWHLVSPAQLPPARFEHGLAYDAQRNRTVLFGGSDSTGLRDDLWEWSAGSWTLCTQAPGPAGAWSPGARSGFGMTYDPRPERVVVWGGESASGCQQDTWSWDGLGWTLHVASTSIPSPRRSAQLLHDPNANQLLLFGGNCGTSLNNDLWSLDLPVFWRSTPYGSGCPGSQGTPALSITSGSAAILGQTLQLQLAHVPAFFSTSFGVIGFNRAIFMGQPVPFDLNAINFRPCLWSSIEGLV